MARLPPRLTGVVLLASAGGSTLLHRWVYDAAHSGPAQLGEFALALTSFLLASAGMLLLIRGARLFVSPRPDGADRRALAIFNAHLDVPISTRGRVWDTRHGAAMMQAQDAIRRARRTRPMVRRSPTAARRIMSDWTLPAKR